MSGVRVPAGNLPQAPIPRDQGIQAAMELFLMEAKADAKSSDEFEKKRRHAFDVLRGAFAVFNVNIPCVFEKANQLEREEKSRTLTSSEMVFLALFYLHLEPGKGVAYLAKAETAPALSSAIADLKGWIYTKGIGVAPDKIQAKKFYETAVNAGYGYAAAELGNFLEREPNVLIEDVCDLYEDAIALDCPLGHWSLSRLCQEGKLSEILSFDERRQKAVELAQKACTYFQAPLEAYLFFVTNPPKHDIQYEYATIEHEFHHVALLNLGHHFFGNPEISDHLLRATVACRAAFYCPIPVGYSKEIFLFRPPIGAQSYSELLDAKDTAPENNFIRRYHISMITGNHDNDIVKLAKENPHLFFDLLKRDLFPPDKFKEKNFRHVFLQESPTATASLEKFESTIRHQTYLRIIEVLHQCLADEKERDSFIVHRIRANLGRVNMDKEIPKGFDVVKEYRHRFQGLNPAYLSPDENYHVGYFFFNEEKEANHDVSYRYLKCAAEAKDLNARDMLIRSAIPKEAKLEELPVATLLKADIKLADTYKEFSQNVRTVLKLLTDKSSSVPVLPATSTAGADAKVSVVGMYGAAVADAKSKLQLQSETKVFENCMRDLGVKINLFRKFFVDAMSGNDLPVKEQIKFKLLKTLYDLITKPVAIDVDEKEHLEKIIIDIDKKLGAKPISIEDLHLPDEKEKERLKANDHKEFTQLVSNVQVEIKPTLDAIKPILSTAIQKLTPPSAPTPFG